MASFNNLIKQNKFNISRRLKASPEFVEVLLLGNYINHNDLKPLARAKTRLQRASSLINILESSKKQRLACLGFIVACFYTGQSEVLLMTDFKACIKIKIAEIGWLPKKIAAKRSRAGSLPFPHAGAVVCPIRENFLLMFDKPNDGLFKILLSEDREKYNNFLKCDLEFMRLCLLHNPSKLTQTLEGECLNKPRLFLSFLEQDTEQLNICMNFIRALYMTVQITLLDKLNKHIVYDLWGVKLPLIHDEGSLPFGLTNPENVKIIFGNKNPKTPQDTPPTFHQTVKIHNSIFNKNNVFFGLTLPVHHSTVNGELANITYSTFPIDQHLKDNGEEVHDMFGNAFKIQGESLQNLKTVKNHLKNDMRSYSKNVKDMTMSKDDIFKSENNGNPEKNISFPYAEIDELERVESDFVGKSNSVLRTTLSQTILPKQAPPQDMFSRGSKSSPLQKRSNENPFFPPSSNAYKLVCRVKGENGVPLRIEDKSKNSKNMSTFDPHPFNITQGLNENHVTALAFGGPAETLQEKEIALAALLHPSLGAPSFGVDNLPPSEMD